MPTSAPGSSRSGHHRFRAQSRRLLRVSGSTAGFTLLELLVVISVVAIAVGVMSLSLRGGRAAKLEEEAARLSALLEMARAEARASGATVRWVPVSPNQPAQDGAQFRFVGLPESRPLPRNWLDPATSAEIIGSTVLVLGPDAILPPQRVVLRLGERRVDVASDGLAPFAQAAAGDEGTSAQ